MPVNKLTPSKFCGLCIAAFLTVSYADHCAAAEDKGPLPLRILNPESLSADEIVQWINMRRDVTAHLFAPVGDKFRELDRFSATFDSCEKYLNKPADLTYDAEKNFYGYLNDQYIGKKVRVACSENLNKFSMQKGVDDIAGSIARLQAAVNAGGSDRNLRNRLEDLSKKLVRQDREIALQNKRLSDIARDLDRIERLVRRTARR